MIFILLFFTILKLNCACICDFNSGTLLCQLNNTFLNKINETCLKNVKYLYWNNYISSPSDEILEKLPNLKNVIKSFYFSLTKLLPI